MLDLIVSTVFWLVMAAGGAVLLVLYFLPTIVVLFRSDHSMVAAVVVVNLLVGWTFLGWLVALVLAVISFPSAQQHYYYAYPQQLAPADGGYQPVPTSPQPAPVTDAAQAPGDA